MRCHLTQHVSHVIVTQLNVLFSVKPCVFSFSVSIKAGFNMQYRECINVPKAEIIQYGCQDAKPFSDIIKMLLKNITDSLEFVQIEHFSFHGNLCLCKEDRCNLNLPMFTSSGPPITKRSTTTPQTSDAPEITSVCYLFCVFLYVMVSVIYKLD